MHTFIQTHTTHVHTHTHTHTTTQLPLAVIGVIHSLDFNCPKTRTNSCFCFTRPANEPLCSTLFNSASSKAVIWLIPMQHSQAFYSADTHTHTQPHTNTHTHTHTHTTTLLAAFVSWRRRRNKKKKQRGLTSPIYVWFW